MSKFDIFNHVAISAGAGSGKTYTLSRRYINILVGFNLFFEDLITPINEADLQTCSPEEIVTITYTEAGALEMKSRIFELIQKVLAYSQSTLAESDDDYFSIKEAFEPLKDKSHIIEHVQKALEKSITELSAATISTIHSFCLDLLDQYSDYLKLDAKPSIISDDEKIVIFSQLYKDELNINATLVEEIDQTISLYNLSKIAQKYSFDAGFRTAFDNYASMLKEDSFSIQKLWLAKKLLPHKEAIVKGLQSAEKMAVIDPKKEQYKKTLHNNIKVVLNGFGEWTEYEGQLRTSKKMPSEVLDPVKKLRDIIGSLRATMVDIDNEEYYKNVLLKIHTLFYKMYDTFVKRLSSEGYTDFETILQYANRLLDQDIKLNKRYFMVDEFQDTNAFQWGIITKAAAKNSANIFIVGDEKQSIFSFQGADVSMFTKASDEIDANKLSMGINRRSDKAIIAFVNDVFGKAMEQEVLPDNISISLTGNEDIDRIIDMMNVYSDIEIVPNDFEAKYERLDTPPKRDEGSVSLLVTPVDHTIKDCEEECNESEQEMRHIASYIQEAISGNAYPIVKKAYQDEKKAIAVLFDTRKHMLLLKRKLLELGIKAKVSDSGNFYDTKEVNDIFIVLKLLTKMRSLDFESLSRRDKYILIGALRSNVLRLDANAIEEVLKSSILPEQCYAWFRDSQYLTPFELIEKIVAQSQLLHVYRHLDTFEQRESNIEMLTSMAYDFSAQKGASLYAYVKDLEDCIHNEEISDDEAFVIEDGVGSIEIRTIHSSKGLEWPMVILGSTNRSFMGMQPSESLVFDSFAEKEIVGFKVGDYTPLAYNFVKERTKQKHIAERKRLLYVAMTRPEHHLVISTSINEYGTGPRLCYSCGGNNYFSIINNVLNLNIEALYMEDEVTDSEISIHYPIKWKGVELKGDKVSVIEPTIIKKMPFTDQSIIRPSGKINPLSFLEEDVFDAGSAGTVVHKIIEECWQNLDDEVCYEKWFEFFSVPNQWKKQIKTMSKAFKQSPHWSKVNGPEEHYFEHDFSMEKDGKQVFGSIDLFYYDDDKHGWIIVDFKTTALRGKSEDEVIIEHGYDKQLEFYAEFVESVMGEGSVVSKEICWLAKS